MTANKNRSDRSASLLTETDELIFCAATGPDQRALDAFRMWRANLVMDEISTTALTAMPLLVGLIKRHRLDDPQLGRMRGMGRHIWVSNTLQLEQLFEALDAIAAAGQTAVLMKGAALYARDSASTVNRRSSDYDILLEPASMGPAAKALEAAGFAPRESNWADFGAGLFESATAGVPIGKSGLHGETDLHWRPLPNIFDVDLTRRIIAAAETMNLEGRGVRVPTPAHHLFLALARCTPSESTESFVRLLEGYFLMTSRDIRIDWEELLDLVDRYGLQPIAFSYLTTISDVCELPVPPEVLGRLEASQTGTHRREWALRSIPPAKLSPLQKFTLAKLDVRFHRARAGMRPAGFVETLLSYPMRLNTARPLLHAMWQLARRRVGGGSAGAPRFLHGFSYPEIEGRWTDARYALFTLPLTDAEKNGQPVRLKARLFCPKGRSAAVVATAGAGTISRRISDADEPLDFVVQCRSLPSLGGDALLLLWLPDAISPLDAGESLDARMLGFFLYRDWHQ